MMPTNVTSIDSLGSAVSSNGVALTSSSKTDASLETFNLPATLPIVPVQQMVFFPGTMGQLLVQSPEIIQLLEKNLPSSKLVGLFLRLSESDGPTRPEHLHHNGVLGTVVKLMRSSDGSSFLLVQCEARIKILSFECNEPPLLAKVEIVNDVLPDLDSDVFQAKVRNLRETAITLVNMFESAPMDVRVALMSINEPGPLTDFLAANLSLEPEEQQALIEDTNVANRVEFIQQRIDNQLRITDLQHKLRADVQAEMTEMQKRAYLREQLRAIQKELGEEGNTAEQNEDLRLRIKNCDLPEAAQQQIERELSRLELLPATSPDRSVAVSYLETVAELPWSTLSVDNLDIAKARKALDHDHFGLHKIKKRLIEFVAVRKLNPTGQGPILCLLGPPGVGKTSLGQSVANALGRKFARVSLGGMRDEAEIRGHRRTYIGAMPGRIIQELRRAGTRNPVFMLDEIDKLGTDFRGDPASALLEVLDPAQNHTFSDRYLDLDFDLSQIIFIATCNQLSTIPAPLRDRMEIIEMAGYTDTEKIHIANDYLVKRQLLANGLTEDQCRWKDDALRAVIEDYTREAGVRELERRIGAVCRSIAAEVAQGSSVKRDIGHDEIKSALGPPLFVREDRLRVSQPGVVTALAYTPVGGEVLYIEALKYAGHGNIVLTGQLGEVMQESVKAGFSLVRSRAAALNIDPELFNSSDVHVHVPAGAIQKDGPSAGVAMYVALASLFSGRSVNKDVAMTGEISLRGMVLPIGGLKEKTIAALRAGVQTVIIPKLNEKDLSDLPQEVTEKLKFELVDTVDDALRLALLDP